MKFFYTIIALLSTHCIAFSQIKITTTTSVFADLIKNIAGEKVQISTIIPVEESPHTYKLQEKDKVLLNDAAIIFQNGLNYEPFLNDFLSKNNNTQKVVVLSEGVTPIPIPNTQNIKDPHAWMSIYNVLFYIHNIKKALCKIDVENTFFYEKNYDAYRAKLVHLEDSFFASLNTLPMNQRVFIDEHKGLYYFARAYNLHYITLNGIDDVEEKDALKRIRKIIREDSVEVIFTEKKINNEAFKALAKDFNAELGETLYSDSVGDAESGILTYTAMLEHNTNAILKGLMKKNTDVPKKTWWEDRINKKILMLIALIIIAIGAFLGYRGKKIQ